MKRSVFFGTPDLAVPIAQATAEVTDLVAVVTQPDRPRGRGKSLAPPPVKVWAQEQGIEVHQPTKLRDGTFAEVLRGLAPDVAVVAAYGRILPKDLLELPPLGCLNVHASLLPKLRGAAPIQWAIANGDAETGVTLMQMDEGLDTGDMLAVRKTPIAADETGGSLHDRLAQLGAQLIREELPRLIAGELSPTPQDESEATYAKILKKEDGRIDFERPAQSIDWRVRGFSPWPGAYTYLEPGGRGLLKVHRVQVAPGDETAAPGTVLSLRPLRVATKDGAIDLLEVQPEGRRRMAAEDFVAGRRVEVGQRLDPDRQEG